MRSEQGLSRPQMARLTDEVRGATRRLTSQQMLDLADMLHDAIRARRDPFRTEARGEPGARLR